MQYLVDPQNRIVDVDTAWDESTVDPGCMKAAVIGRPLESFMIGDATKMFVRAALDAVRLLRQARTLPYRCDSADQHRWFDMVLTPQADGLVRVEHRLVRTQPLRRRRAAPASHPHGPAVWRCSQCMRVRHMASQQWVQSTLQAGALLAQDVCPDCAAQLFGTNTPHQKASSGHTQHG